MMDERRPAPQVRRPRPAVYGLVLAVLGLLLAFSLILRISGSSRQSSARTVSVVAAETFYGSMLQQIGGSHVTVVSLLDNPNTDPHMFEASAQTARQVGTAPLVVKNGIGYDAWVDKLLAASPRSGRTVISVGELLGHRDGDNPHVWYDPNGWSRESDAFTRSLSRLDPKNAHSYATGEARYLRSLRPLRAEIASLRRRVHGTQVTATEPVFGYMAAALGLRMRNLDFQKSIMDGTDPAPQALARFEADLRQHRVRLLLYNNQTSEPVTVNVRQIARKSHIPVVGVSELAPRNRTFQQWQLLQLRQVDAALSHR